MPKRIWGRFQLKTKEQNNKSLNDMGPEQQSQQDNQPNHARRTISLGIWFLWDSSQQEFPQGKEEIQ